MHRALLPAVLSLSILLSTRVAAQDTSYTFTPLNVPGAITTVATGINKQGQIVGWYRDSNTVHCFLYSNGLFTTLDVPADCRSINSQGQIVGFVGDHSFLYDGGELTTFQLPDSVETQAWGINDSSQIVGSYQNSNEGRYSFLYEEGVFTTIAVPGAFLTTAHGINTSSQIVGLYQDSNNVRYGFLYDDGVFTTIAVPPGASHAATEFNGINASGQIVGRYVVVNGQNFHGFLYEGGVFTTIAVPGAIHTGIFGINDEGQIVGTFTNSTGEHGFLATPVQVDTIPPQIRVSANPATLPPKGKLVTVTVSGTIVDDEPDDSGVQTGSTGYRVIDEYGQIQPSGSFTLDADGEYSFTVRLEASRKGNDKDGRHYTIEVSATDNAGNSGTESATVTVPRK